SGRRHGGSPLLRGAARSPWRRRCSRSCPRAYRRGAPAALSGSLPTRHPFATTGSLCSRRDVRGVHRRPGPACGAVDQLAEEFDGIFDRSHVDAIVHDSARQLEGTAVESFVPILAQRFARERLRAQALNEGKLAKSVTEVVFVSITGGGRARMAA